MPCVQGKNAHRAYKQDLKEWLKSQDPAKGKAISSEIQKMEKRQKQAAQRAAKKLEVAKQSWIVAPNYPQVQLNRRASNPAPIFHHTSFGMAHKTEIDYLS